MELSEEEKEAFKVLKDLLEDFEDVEKWVIVNFSKKEFESLRICVNLIEKQQEKIKELTAFYNDFESGKITNYPMYKQRYISKDKIREKIKELENQPKHGYNTHSDFLYESDEVTDIVIDELKDLLKEDNND